MYGAAGFYTVFVALKPLYAMQPLENMMQFVGDKLLVGLLMDSLRKFASFFVFVFCAFFVYSFGAYSWGNRRRGPVGDSDMENLA